MFFETLSFSVLPGWSRSTRSRRRRTRRHVGTPSSNSTSRRRLRLRRRESQPPADNPSLVTGRPDWRHGPRASPPAMTRRRTRHRTAHRRSCVYTAAVRSSISNVGCCLYNSLGVTSLINHNMLSFVLFCGVLWYFCTIELRFACHSLGLLGLGLQFWWSFVNIDERNYVKVLHRFQCFICFYFLFSSVNHLKRIVHHNL